MKKSAVNRRVFLTDIKHSWPIWAGQCLAYLLIYLPQMLVSFEVENYGASRLDVTALIACAADFLIVLMVFGFMNNPRSANFFFSMPISRESLFITKLTACLTAVFVPFAVIGVTVLIAGGFGVYAFASVLMLLLAHITFLGMALLLITLIGHSVAYAAISAIMLFVFQVVLYCLESITRAILFGFPSNGGIFQNISGAFSPIIHFISAAFRPGTEGPIAIFGYTDFVGSYVLAAVGTACAILSFFAFRRRKAESAGDIVVFGGLRPVLKYGVAVCSALTLGALMISSFRLTPVTSKNLPLVCLIVVFNTGLGYFAAEMLIQKRFNVFLRSFKGFAAAAAVLVTLTVCAELDVIGYETYVPAADDIESIQTYGAEMLERDDLERVIALHGYMTRQKAVSEFRPKDAQSVMIATPFGPMSIDRNRTDYYDKLELVSSDSRMFFDRFINAHYNDRVYLQYVMKDGSVIRRNYSASQFFYDQAAVDGYRKLHYDMAHSFVYARSQTIGYDETRDFSTMTAAVHRELASDKLDNARARLLYDAVLEDMRALNIGVDEIAPPAPERPATLMNDTIVFTFYYDVTEVYNGKPAVKKLESGYAVTLDRRAANTLALLDEWGIAVS